MPISGPPWNELETGSALAHAWLSISKRNCANCQELHKIYWAGQMDGVRRGCCLLLPLPSVPDCLLESSRVSLSPCSLCLWLEGFPGFSHPAGRSFKDLGKRWEGIFPWGWLSLLAVLFIARRERVNKDTIRIQVECILGMVWHFRFHLTWLTVLIVFLHKCFSLFCLQDQSLQKVPCQLVTRWCEGLGSFT